MILNLPCIHHSIIYINSLPGTHKITHWGALAKLYRGRALKTFCLFLSGWLWKIWKFYIMIPNASRSFKIKMFICVGREKNIICCKFSFIRNRREVTLIYFILNSYFRYNSIFWEFPLSVGDNFRWVWWLWWLALPAVQTILL